MEPDQEVCARNSVSRAVAQTTCIAGPLPTPAGSLSPALRRRGGDGGTCRGRANPARWLEMLLRSLLTIAIAAVVVGCRPAPEPVAVPAELRGVWKTAHPRYEDRFFELTVNTITLGIGEDSPQAYPIEKFEKRQEMREIIYSLTYLVPSEGVANTLSFYYEPRGGGTIWFKNQRHVEWRKGPVS